MHWSPEHHKIKPLILQNEQLRQETVNLKKILIWKEIRDLLLQRSCQVVCDDGMQSTRRKKNQPTDGNGIL